MKKRSKKLAILAAVLALMIAGTVAVIKLNPKEAETAADPAEAPQTLVDMDALDIKALNYKSEGRNLTFEYGKDGWTYTENTEFPVSQSLLEAMFNKIASLTYTKSFDTEDMAEYGLAEPVCDISILASSPVHLLIGSQSAMSDERYVSLGGKTVYLVDGTVLDAFDYDLMDLVEKEEIPSMSGVLRLTVTTAEGTRNFVKMEDSDRAYSTQYYWFLQDGSDYTTLDNENTSAFVSTVTGLSWGDCVNWQAADSDLVEYGLDRPAVTASVDFAAAEGDEVKETFTLEMGKVTEDGCYARIPGSAMVYLIKASAPETLSASTESLLPDEVLLMNWDAVTGFDVVSGGKTYTVTRAEAAEDEAAAWTLDGQPFDAETLFTALDNVPSAGSVSGADPGPVDLAFVFRQDSYHFPEVKLSFAGYDSGSCLSTLNGESRLLVQRADFTKLLGTVTTLLQQDPTE